MKIKKHTFYSIYFNVLSLIMCAFCIIITFGRDNKMFVVSIILTVVVLAELASNIVHFIKFNKKAIDK